MTHVNTPIGRSNTSRTRGVLLLAKGHRPVLSLICNDAHWRERSAGELNVEVETTRRMAIKAMYIVLHYHWNRPE